MPEISHDYVQEALNRLKNTREVVYDVETSGLDWKRNAPVGHVLAFGPAPQDSFYIPVRHGGGGNLNDAPGLKTATSWNGKLHPFEKELIKHIDRQNLTVVGHSLSFDLKFLWRLGAQFKANYQDTIIAAPLLDEWQRAFSLEFCANKAGVEAKKSKEIVSYLCEQFPEIEAKGAMGHFWRLSGNDPMAIEYAAGDGVSTWQLWEHQLGELDSQQLMTVWEVESRLIPVLARMSCLGIKIDEERLGEVRQHIKDTVEELKNEFPSGFNPRSPNAVKAWMEQNGETSWPKTPTGAPSFVESWLGESEAGQKVIDIRKFETLESTFLGPMVERHVFKGRVHTTYNQLRGDEYGTVTGRLSCSDPNLQAVSKHNEKIGRLHRSIFVPDDGKVWGATDYSQIEPRLLAMYSGCKVLVDGYNATPPIDAHMSASIAANKGRWETWTKEQQKAYRNNFGKRLNQTIITGGGKNVLTAKYKVPADEVNKVWNDYHKAMPEIRQLQKRAEGVMKSRGWVLSLLGRRARLLDQNKAYTATNRLLQCGNADIMKTKLCEVDEYLASVGRPIDILNTIHDSVDYQFDEDNRHHYERCKQIMVDFGPDQLIKIDKIPIVVDAGEGSDWSIATFGKEK